MTPTLCFRAQLVVCTLLLACGDSRGGTGTAQPDVFDDVGAGTGADARGGSDPGDTGAPDTHDGADLPERDATPDADREGEVTLLDLCEDALDALVKVEADTDTLEQYCLIGAIAGATDVEGAPTCEQLYATCLENPGLLRDLAEAYRERVGGCAPELAECVITRSGLDACLAEREAQLAQVELSCDADVDALTEVLARLGPACASLQDACDDEPDPNQGGYTYPACGEPFDACGGDPTGDWTFDAVCLEPDDAAFDSLLAVCPRAQLTATATARGELRLEADGGGYRRHLEIERTLEIHAPSACADVICDLMYETFDCNNRIRENNVCTCTDRSSAGLGHNAWVQDGNTFRADANGPPTWTFCQEADALTVQPSDGFHDFLIPRFTLHRATE